MKEKTLTRNCPICLYHNLEETNIITVGRIIKNGNSVKLIFGCVAIKKGECGSDFKCFLDWGACVKWRVDFPSNLTLPIWGFRVVLGYICSGVFGC